MVTAERIDSLATSENQAARGVRIYDGKVGARLSPGGGERGEGFPLIGRVYPRVSTNLWHLAPLSPEYLHALPRHYEKYAECLRSCGTSNTCTSSILPGSSHLVFTPQKAATSDQEQKQKQLMSNADVCVISSEQGGAIILEITRKVMM